MKLFERDGTLRAGLLAGALFAGEFSCIYLGLRDTAASRLTVFLYTSPFVVALLLPRMVPSEKLRPVQWVGLVIAFAAVALAFSEGFSGETHAAAIARRCAGAGRRHAVGPDHAGDPRQRHGDGQRGEDAVLPGGRDGGGGAAAVAGAGRNLVAALLGYAWVSLALQTVIGAFASYLAWMWMLRHYPATQLSSFTFLAPCSRWCWAWCCWTRS